MSDDVMRTVASKDFSDFSVLLSESESEKDQQADKVPSTEKASITSSRNNRLEIARRIFDMRRSREQFLPTELFSEPAWDILLFLYMARAEQHRTTVGAACGSAGVPVSTALRWVQRLVMVGMVTKEPHPTDQRVNWLLLTADTECQLDRFFDRLEGQNWI